MNIPQLLIIAMFLYGCPDEPLVQQDFSDADAESEAEYSPKDRAQRLVAVREQEDAGADVSDSFIPDAEVDSEVVEPEPEPEPEPVKCTLDTDGDGWVDCEDLCPSDPNKNHPGLCGCWVSGEDDRDEDGVISCKEQCPNDPNKILVGLCGCGKVETGDRDLDGTVDCRDNCPDNPQRQRAPC